ncbi:glycosyltransferase family 4 protein [Granulicatella sp. 19428wC4_WM01]|nr:glycosyltransferase family 4 protein [Granulicatella sp. 19428wC4_WM01]MBF0780881.1 glycosyltransferase family 4 protein [Granulicatella sp. 19428wC4_WM01]TFU93476.1 glycosyltransferase [Granulicatella sp. WM01]
MEHQIRALEHKEGVQLVNGKKEEYDIVHFNMFFPHSVLSAMIAKWKKKKVVFHAHSTMEDFKDSFIGSNLIAYLFKWWIVFAYTRGDVIITPTDYSKKLLQSYGIKKRIEVVSNGIDVAYFENKHPIKRQKNIMSVGHFIERKGLLDFIELAKQMPEYEFYWYGHTAEALQTPRIKEALQTNLPNLHFPGYLSKDELKEKYHDMGLFLFMTHEETEGIVLLEAFAAEIPVLVRDIDIYKTMFIENEVVYKFTDNHVCCQKVIDILEEKVPSLTKRAYQEALKRDIDKIGDQLIEVYQSI